MVAIDKVGEAAAAVLAERDESVRRLNVWGKNDRLEDGLGVSAPRKAPGRFMAAACDLRAKMLLNEPLIRRRDVWRLPALLLGVSGGSGESTAGRGGGW